MIRSYLLKESVNNPPPPRLLLMLYVNDAYSLNFNVVVHVWLLLSTTRSSWLICVYLTIVTFQVLNSFVRPLSYRGPSLCVRDGFHCYPEMSSTYGHAPY